jgi:hypothetical protein
MTLTHKTLITNTNKLLITNLITRTMKTTIVTTIFLMVFGIGMAQQPNFEDAMKETITMYDSAKTISDLQAAANRFE